MEPGKGALVSVIVQAATGRLQASGLDSGATIQALKLAQKSGGLSKSISGMSLMVSIAIRDALALEVS